MKHIEAKDLSPLITPFHRSCWICEETVMQGNSCFITENKDRAVCPECYEKASEKKVLFWD